MFETVKLAEEHAVRSVKVVRKKVRVGDKMYYQYVITLPSILMRTVFREIRLFSIHIGLLRNMPVIVLIPEKSPSEDMLMVFGMRLEDALSRQPPQR